MNSGRQIKGRAFIAALAVVLVAIAPRAAVAISAGQPSGRAATKGNVSVLYAGSLLAYMEDDLGPAFQRASGFGFSGFGGGSTELAGEIHGGVRRGDVFVSASAAADKTLEGTAGGGWVSWYSTFVGSPLMLAYNPHSALGAELARGVPWYRALAKPGIRVGRTDPKLDPKGILTVEAVDAAAHRLHDPALAGALPSFAVFPETTLVGRLQAGQLDAGFFYAVEAKTAKLATVPLTPIYKYALYTVTILKGAPDPAGAAAFARYLLDPRRAYTLRTHGLTPSKPIFSGSVAAVPRSLRSVVGAH